MVHPDGGLGGAGGGREGWVGAPPGPGRRIIWLAPALPHPYAAALQPTTARSPQPVPATASDAAHTDAHL